MKAGRATMTCANKGKPAFYLNQNVMRQTIAYVDDDLEDQMLLEESLRDYLNVDIKFFTMGSSLRTHLDQAPQNLSMIILDMNLPLQNGFELLGELRDKYQLTIPICLFSTVRDCLYPEIIQKYSGQYFTKPTTMAGYRQLADALIDQLGESSRKTENI